MFLQPLWGITRNEIYIVSGIIPIFGYATAPVILESSREECVKKRIGQMDERARDGKKYSLARISKRDGENTNIYRTFRCFVADPRFPRLPRIPFMIRTQTDRWLFNIYIHPGSWSFVLLIVPAVSQTPEERYLFSHGEYSTAWIEIIRKIFDCPWRFIKQALVTFLSTVYISVKRISIVVKRTTEIRMFLGGEFFHVILVEDEALYSRDFVCCLLFDFRN